MKRVVITGIGAVTPVGNNIKDTWDSLVAGKHGIAPIEGMDVSDIPVKVAGQVKNFDPLQYFEKKELRRNDRYTQFAIAAAEEAVTDCGTKFEDLDAYRVGVIFGSGIGGFQTIETEYEKFLEKGPNRVSVFFVPMMISNMAAGQIAMRFGFKGANYAPVTACATSSHALGEAFHKIKFGQLDACAAGGAEAAVTRFAMAGFNNMKALSQSEDPNRASIPFDADRNGFVMGEGAGCVILEELEHAKARGAKIYAEVVGYGATADAYHITSPAPDGAGAAKAMQLAMEEGNVAPEQVTYVNAHGTSTGLNDKYETIAIRRALGAAADAVMVSSTKSMTGHMLGAAGAVEAIVCAKCIEEGIVVPTANYQNPDPECNLDVVPNQARKADVKVAISNSLGFGGHNASICLKKYEE